MASPLFYAALLSLAVFLPSLCLVADGQSFQYRPDRRYAVPEGQGNGTCMTKWLLAYRSGVSRDRALEYEQALAEFIHPIDEHNAQGYSLLLLSFLLGGRSNARDFVNCLTHQSLHCSTWTPCQNNGACLFATSPAGESGQYRCKCTDGYRGKFCSLRKDPCIAKPCRHGGRCVSHGNGSYHCVCRSLHSGKDCQETWLSRRKFDDLSSSHRSLADEVHQLKEKQNSILSSIWDKTSAFLLQLSKRVRSSVGLMASSITGNVTSIETRLTVLEEKHHQEELMARTTTETTTTGAMIVKQTTQEVAPTTTDRLTTGLPLHGDERTCPQRNRRLAETDVRSFTFPGVKFRTVCNMSVDGGGWIVIQRRTNDSMSFDRYWQQYKAGFGNVHGSFWLGLENMHRLTSSGQFQLRIDMTTFDGVQHYMKYDNFSIGPETKSYQLHLAGFSSGTLQDRFIEYHNLKTFKAKGKDGSTARYSTRVGSGWWFGDCLTVNLNGIIRPQHWRGIVWSQGGAYYNSKYMNFAEMKVRRV